MKKFLAFVMALVFVTGAFSLASANMKMHVLCDPNSYVNIRKDPNSKAYIMGKLYAMDDVTVIASRTVGNTTWYQIDVFLESGNVGWVSGGFLVYDEISYYKTGVEAKIKAKGGVHSRKSIDGKIRSKIKDRSTVQVFLYSNEWCVTNRGYIKTKFIDWKETKE